MPFPPIDPDTAERQTLDEIIDWHQSVVVALNEQRTRVQRSIRDESIPAPVGFETFTEAEVDARFDRIRLNLDRLASFNLVASAEASIRVDYALSPPE